MPKKHLLNIVDFTHSAVCSLIGVFQVFLLWLEEVMADSSSSHWSRLTPICQCDKICLESQVTCDPKVVLEQV